MIVGNGLIANAIKSCDREGVILFASGVSNSVNPVKEDFEREEKLLKNELVKPQKLVYFSTISIEDPDCRSKAYILHKLRMEDLVKTKSNYLILRLPNMASLSGNPKNLFPFFYNSILKGNQVIIKQNASRYLLTSDQLCFMLNELLDKQLSQEVINCIHGEPMMVEDIYIKIANYLEAQPNYQLQEGGKTYTVKSNYKFGQLPELSMEKLIKANYISQ